MPGIATLAELIVEIVDDDDAFTGTVYGGPAIVRAHVAQLGRTARLRTSEHPNLMRKFILLNLLRVREGAGNPQYRSLLLAIYDKLRNNQKIKNAFEDRVTFVDDPDDPAITGVTAHKPYLGIHDADFGVAPQFSGMREEEVPVELYIYQQRFPSSMNTSLVGD
jgi:hypothetical protein